MSDENQHTDAGASHTDEVNSESVDPQSSSDETTGNTDEHLDFDTLLPKAGQTDPHNKRGGLSRREAAKLKEEQSDEPDDISILKEELDAVKSQLAEQNQATIRSKAESSFMKDLEQSGLSVKEFNSKYKEEYLEEYNDFVELGLSPERAAAKARKLVLPAIKAADTEKRAEGRVRASLPPQGKPQGQQVYKTSTLIKLAKTNKQEYQRIMKARENGTVQVID